MFRLFVFCIAYSAVNYLNVSFKGFIRLGKRELFFLLAITCNYVVSVRRGFLFLLVLQTGCVVSLLHSLGLPLCHIIKEHISYVIRKPAFCICKHKGADHLRGNHTPDQCLFFCYMDGKIPIHSKFQASNQLQSRTAWSVSPGQKL